MILQSSTCIITCISFDDATCGYCLGRDSNCACILQALHLADVYMCRMCVCALVYVGVWGGSISIQYNRESERMLQALHHAGHSDTRFEVHGTAFYMHVCVQTDRQTETKRDVDICRHAHIISYVLRHSARP